MPRHTLWRQHMSSGVALFLSVCLYLVDWIKFSALHVLGKYFTTELSPQLSCVCKNALWGPNSLLSLPLVIILQDSAILGAVNCGTIGSSPTVHYTFYTTEFRHRWELGDESPNGWVDNPSMWVCSHFWFCLSSAPYLESTWRVLPNRCVPTVSTPF